jgi:quinol monooxygenase YgiN
VLTTIKESVMSEVRALSQGSTSDPAALRAWAATWIEGAPANETGALSWEMFIDERAGKVTFIETWASPQDFGKHFQHLTTSGQLEALMQVYEVEQMTFLSPVTEEIQPIVDQLQALTMEKAAEYAS